MQVRSLPTQTGTDLVGPDFLCRTAHTCLCLSFSTYKCPPRQNVPHVLMQLFVWLPAAWLVLYAQDCKTDVLSAHVLKQQTPCYRGSHPHKDMLSVPGALVSLFGVTSDFPSKAWKPVRQFTYNGLLGLALTQKSPASQFSFSCSAPSSDGNTQVL